MMFFADAFSPGQPVFMLLMLIAVTFMIRWALSAPGRQRSVSRKSVQEDARQRDASASAQMTRLEVRLHDFSREVDGRIQTRMAILDRLIIDAEREIQRLQNLLGQTSPDGGPSGQRQPDMLLFPSPPPSPLAQNQTGTAAANPDRPPSQELLVRVCTLSDAGLCDDDVAVQTGVPVSRIRAILRNRHSLRFDAA